jgi:hypothetical protein
LEISRTKRGDQEEKKMMQRYLPRVDTTPSLYLKTVFLRFVAILIRSKGTIKQPTLIFLGLDVQGREAYRDPETGMFDLTLKLSAI